MLAPATRWHHTSMARARLASTTPGLAQQISNCENRQGPQAPGAEKQDADWCPDLTTKTLGPDHTRQDDWAGLHAAETTNPAEGLIPGLQIDGYFPTAPKPTATTMKTGSPVTTRSS